MKMTRDFVQTARWLALVGAFCAARLDGATIENPALRVELDDRSGALTVIQKSTGRIWRQLPEGNELKVLGTERRGNRLVVLLDAGPTLRATIGIAGNSDLEVSIAADNRARISRFDYPGPFVTPSASWNLVMPAAEGFLVPVRGEMMTLIGRRYRGVLPLESMAGLIMPWLGLTDGHLGSGYMMIVGTPFDAEIKLSTVAGLPAPSPRWLPEFGRFGYPRVVRYHFFDEGGYVAQAKHYRQGVLKAGRCPTLRERARRTPQIRRLVGAVHIYTWGNARTVAFAEELHEAGIDRAWIGWDPSHPPYPKPGLDDGLKQLGYLAGVYDLYRAMYCAPEALAVEPELKSLWLDRYLYPGQFNTIVARDAQGRPIALGRPAPPDRRGGPPAEPTRFWVSTAAILPHITERITRELEVYPHDSIFIDVSLAAPPMESYDPTYPMSRTEDAADRVAINRDMADFLHLVVGSEYGADYGVPCTDFVHGAMTLHMFWRVAGTADRSSPYYLGDFDDITRPSAVLGEALPTPTYLKFGLGEYYRIPLYELVYHDCTVSSWRWDDDSRKEPGVWWKKDLFNALYGTAPLWNLDRMVWKTHRTEFVASFRKLSPVLKAVQFDDMLDHRFVTPDREVQETVFASGTQVFANFGDRPRVIDGRTIPARDFVLIGK